jgi:hypothetical protein
MQKNTPTHSEYVLEIRFTTLGPRAQPRYRLSGRCDGRTIHDNKDLTADAVKRFMRGWTNDLRSAMSHELPIIDARIMADVQQYAAKHRLTRKQALTKMGLPATFAYERPHEDA